MSGVPSDRHTRQISAAGTNTLISQVISWASFREEKYSEPLDVLCFNRCKQAFGGRNIKKANFHKAYVNI